MSEFMESTVRVLGSEVAEYSCACWNEIQFPTQEELLAAFADCASSHNVQVRWMQAEEQSDPAEWNEPEYRQTHYSLVETLAGDPHWYYCTCGEVTEVSTQAEVMEALWRCWEHHDVDHKEVDITGEVG